MICQHTVEQVAAARTKLEKEIDSLVEWFSHEYQIDKCQIKVSYDRQTMDDGKRLWGVYTTVVSVNI